MFKQIVVWKKLSFPVQRSLRPAFLLLLGCCLQCALRPNAQASSYYSSLVQSSQQQPQPKVVEKNTAVAALAPGQPVERQISGGETQSYQIPAAAVGYYKRLLQGAGRGEALRQAQLQMLNDKTRRHPYYWAGFIQTGEWANLEGKR